MNGILKARQIENNRTSGYKQERKRPCIYSADEFAGVLREADEDYKAGRFVSQEELRERYGL